MLIRKALRFALLFLATLIATFDANASTFLVTRFDDTAATAGGSATGAGDGPGVAGDLRNTILLANSVGGAGNTINFVCLTAPAVPCVITLNGPLPPITSNMTIDGGSFGNIVIDGNNAYRVFFVDTGTVTLNHLEIRNASATGGAGGDGNGPGGGAAGFGAGLFVNQATAAVTVQNTYFLNCGVTGGSGGNAAGTQFGGGGGGLAFAGGGSTVFTGGGGGGGVTGPGAASTSANGANGGPGGGGGGGANDITHTPGNGGSGYATNSGGAAGGGPEGSNGGNGGFGGGGGGGSDNGGNGGFGGGGGGGSGTTAGNGGFGGGGGGTSNGATAGSSAAAVGGIHGGSGGGNFGPGSSGGAGGGAAAGPAIFVNAGILTLQNTTGSTFSATAGTAGAGAGAGGPPGAAGTAGTANSTPVFNYGGSVNGSTTQGAITGALPGGLPATHFGLVPSSNSVQAFQQVDVTVTALDINNNPATGYNGNVNFTSTEDPNLVYSLCQNNCPAANTNPPTTWTNGVATWDFSPKKAGTFTITATDTVDSTITGTSSSITCTPGSINGLTLTGIPASTASGAAFSFTVTAHDLFNNTATNNSTDVIAITSSDGAANLPASAPLVNGVVSFSITLNTGGNQTITATDATASVSATSPSIRVTAPPPTITASFSPSTVAVGGSRTTTLTVTVTNPNAFPLTGIAFSNTYPAGVVADVIATDGCTTGSRSFTSAGVTVTGVTLAGGASCSEAVQMHASTAAAITDTTSTVTANESTAAGAAASATLNAMNPPTLSAVFGAGSIAFGGSTSLSFTVSNPNSIAGLTGVAFSDTLPAGLVVSTPNGLSGSCGTITATAGSGVVSMSSLSLALSGTCTFSVNVTAIATGVQSNVTGAVTSNEGGAGGTASASITVNKASQTITFGALPAHTWGDAPFTVSATATSGQAVTFSVTSGSCSIVGTTVTITGAGSCVIAANQSGNATYSAAPAVSQTLTINPAVLTVTANAATKVSGAPLPTFTATISGFVNGDTAAVVGGAPTFSTTATAISPAGTYPITPATGTLTAANYSFSFVNGTLTVTPSVLPPLLTVTFGLNSIPFGGSTSLNFTVTNPGPSQLTGIGFSATLPAGLALAAPNGLSGSCLSAGNVAVSGKNISVSGLSVANTSSCSFSVNVVGTALGVQDAVAGPVNSAQTGTGTTDYVNSVTVTQASQTIAFGPVGAHTYGDAPFVLSATATSNLPVTVAVTSGPCSVSSTTLTIIGAGTCVITASQGGNTNYSAATSVTQTITVNKATLTVTGNSATIAAGAALPGLAASFSGFVNGDTAAAIGGAPSVTTSATSSSPAGSYPIVVTAGTLAASNYSFAFVNGTLTITPAPVNGPAAVDNSATYGPALAAPNTILTLFGTALSCTPNPQVLINGTAAQVLFANATQINFVMPGQIASGGPVSIEVVCNGNVLGTLGVTPAQVDPAIFTQTGTGTGPGSIVNLDGTVNTASNPTSRGSYISVYVTGFGTYNPPSPDGLERMTFPVTAMIGGIAANVIYAGEAPGETSGLQQVNIQVPANAPLGPNVPIVLTVDGVSTEAGVTVAIQ